MEEESWGIIPGWEEYEVSTDGRIRKVGCGTFITQMLTGEPKYFYCNLRKDSGRKLLRVHRLVALTHIPNPYNLPIVDHIDQDRFNNRVSNLRWVCSRGNQRNRKDNIRCSDGVHLWRRLEDDYGETNTQSHLYQFFYLRVKEGVPYPQIKTRWKDKLEQDRKNTQASDNLRRLCVQLGKDYTSVKKRVDSGWHLWNALYDIPHEHPHSMITGEDEYGLGYWVPSRGYLADKYSVTKDTISEWLKVYSLRDILSSRPTQELRMYSLDFQGKRYTGTIAELRESTGLDDDAIRWRHSNPQQRVIRHSINGVSKRNREWFEYFGLQVRTAGNYMSRHKCFRSTLEYYGVDTSDMDIKPA